MLCCHVVLCCVVSYEKMRQNIRLYEFSERIEDEMNDRDEKTGKI